ncbi:MAG: Arm DNA-binding domain-containing protein [Candidatus Thiodiazotropha sp. L084R]
MKIHRLSQRKVETAKPGTHSDGGGLRFVISNAYSKRWTFRYVINGKQREMGLGSYPDVSLDNARERAFQYRSLAKENIDPILIRDEERRKNAEASEKALNTKNIPSFTTCAARYIRINRRAWDNHKHAKQWARTLKTDVVNLFDTTQLSYFFHFQ